MYGHKSAPSWIVIIDVARQWGVPPYKVTGGTKTLWFARMEAIRHAESKRAFHLETKRKAQQMEADAKRR